MANIKRKTQKQYTQKDFHRFTKPGTVAAAPVHTTRIPKFGSGDTDAMLDTLDNLASAAADIQKDRIKRLREAGIVAAARGEAKPGDAFGSKTYEVATGMAQSTPYKLHMQAKQAELFRNNPEISQRKFNKAMTQAGNAYTKDMTDNNIVGLSDTLIEIGAGIDAAWLQHDTERIQVEGKGSLTQMAIDAAEQVSAIKGLPNKDKAQRLRTAMNDIYKLADAYQLEKPDLTSHLTKVLGEKYAAEGSPHKLSWMLMGDESGIVPSQTKDGIAAEDYIRQATATADQMMSNAEKSFATKKKAAAMDLGRDLIEAVNTLDPTDAEAWAKERLKLVKYKSLFTPQELKGYYATIDLMQDPGNFSRIGDNLETEQELRVLARKGQLNFARLNRNTKLLTKPTYTKILNEQLSAMDKADGRADKSTQLTKIASQLNKLETSFLAMSGATVSKTGELIAGLSGDPRKRRFLRTLQQKWMHYIAYPQEFMDKEGRLDQKSIADIEERIYNEVQGAYPELINKLRTQDKAAGTPAFEPKSNEQAKQLSAIERLKKSKQTKKE